MIGGLEMERQKFKIFRRVFTSSKQKISRHLKVNENGCEIENHIEAPAK